MKKVTQRDTKIPKDDFLHEYAEQVAERDDSCKTCIYGLTYPGGTSCYCDYPVNSTHEFDPCFDGVYNYLIREAGGMRRQKSKALTNV